MMKQVLLTLATTFIASTAAPAAPPPDDPFQWLEEVRGVWRRARVDSYRAGTPEWEVLLDIDALAAAEERNWVFSSVDCLSPDYVRCMVELSDGGTDAGVWREFNTDEKAFVQAGFYLPEGKSCL